MDTNVVVSNLLVNRPVPAQAVQKAVSEAVVLQSDPNFAELSSVLLRSRIDRYLSVENRMQFLNFLAQIAESIEIVWKYTVCRSPKYDKLIDISVNGRADVIVTGDADLLALHPFMDIPIHKPSDWL